MRQKQKSLLAFGIVILFAGIVYVSTGFYFQTNDDRIIAEILSGSMTGVPDAHAVYLNYFLSYFLMLLYRINNAVPWYGLYVVSCFLLALYLILESFFEKCSCCIEMITVAILSGGVFCAGVYMLASVQYTSVTAVLAAAGYVYFLFHDKNRKTFLVFMTAELAACLLRDSAMLMVQPFGMAILLGFFLIEGRHKENWKNPAIMFGIVFGVLGISVLGNFIGYGSAEWKEFYKYSDAREILVDYYGVPEYQEVRHILDKYDVTELEYQAVFTYVTLDEDISADCISELAEYAKGKGSRSLDFSQMWSHYLTGQYFGMSKVLLVIWACAVGWLLLNRQWRSFLPLFGLFSARMIVWSYLEYIGRMPQRVTFPLIFIELFMLAAICLCTYRGSKADAIKKFSFLALCLCFITGSVLSGYKQYKEASDVNRSKKVMEEALHFVKDYCAKHPENCYILDDMTFSSCTSSAFNTSVYGEMNCIYTGGWYSNSPTVLERLDAYLPAWQDTTENIYLIVLDVEGDGPFKMSQKYLTDKTGIIPEAVDSFMLPTGGNYLVLKY